MQGTRQRWQAASIHTTTHCQEHAHGPSTPLVSPQAAHRHANRGSNSKNTCCADRQLPSSAHLNPDCQQLCHCSSQGVPSNGDGFAAPCNLTLNGGSQASLPQALCLGVEASRDLTRAIGSVIQLAVDEIYKVVATGSIQDKRKCVIKCNSRVAPSQPHKFMLRQHDTLSPARGTSSLPGPFCVWPCGAHVWAYWQANTMRSLLETWQWLAMVPPCEAGFSHQASRNSRCGRTAQFP